MSGASDAVAALHEAAQGVYRGTYEAGGAFAKAVQGATRADDVVQTMAAMIDVVVAAERLHDEAEAAVKSARAALAEQMSATGATSIQGQHHTAHLSRRPAFVSIDDESVLPPEFIVQRPSIDKKAIASAIKDGVTVAGASLLTPNEPMLVLRARKEAA